MLLADFQFDFKQLPYKKFLASQSAGTKTRKNPCQRSAGIKNTQEICCRQSAGTKNRRLKPCRCPLGTYFTQEIPCGQSAGTKNTGKIRCRQSAGTHFSQEILCRRSAARLILKAVTKTISMKSLSVRRSNKHPTAGIAF